MNVSGKHHTSLEDSLTSHIHLSQREVTVLFTDIEDSTRYWGNRGDVEGRLMVDRHNRLLLPLVRQFHGRVIKTIGDSIMAVFNHPEHATEAAIAMQQALQRSREEDPDFRIRVRIGLHIGEGIVESNDVYGDVVNISSRVESEAEGSEILISGRLARRLDKVRFARRKKGSFTPKGKNKAMALYRIDWQQHDDLLAGVKRSPLLPLGRQQSLEMLGYIVLLIGSLYYIHLNYFRYLLADNETLALAFLNPADMLRHYWYVGIASAAGLLALLWWAMGINAIPQAILRWLKAISAGAVMFVLLHTLTQQLPPGTLLRFSEQLHRSTHLFVEVMAEQAAIHDAPDDKAAILMQQGSGTLFLLTDVRKNGDTVWNKVLIGENRFGWIKRIQPPRLGVVEERITLAQPFQLRYGDLYLLLLALPGFIWGYRSFRVRPI